MDTGTALKTVAAKRLGDDSLVFPSQPVITATATVAGPMEGSGPLGPDFDRVKEDHILGLRSFEAAEQAMMKEALDVLLERAKLTWSDIDLFLGGDLLNQIISSNFTARKVPRPFLGLYGACSTTTEGLLLAAALVDGGFAQHVGVVVASHHQTAERQYRYPNELGVQRVPTSTWTATGAAAFLVSREGEGPVITHATPGRVIDQGVKDPNNMGAAMAPAAAHTLSRHFADIGREPSFYDWVLTGDLGKVGVPVTEQLVRKAGYTFPGNITDCGLLLYHPSQGVDAGGSGAVCSGLVFGASIWKRLLKREMRHILLAATGSLHSPTSFQQGESIPGICHAVAIAAERGEGA